MKMRILAGLIGLTAFAPQAQAAVTKFIVESRVPYPQDASFELLSGHFEGALNPTDSHNTIITDIALAPRNAQGKIEYAATFQILKPADLSKASGLLFYQVVNRGHGAPGYFPDGHIGVASGWQGDLPEQPGLATIKVPIARNTDGSAILGEAYARLLDMAPGTASMPIAENPGAEAGRNFEPATANGARLVKTASDTAPPVEVPRSDWVLADCSVKPFPGVPDLSTLPNPRCSPPASFSRA